MAQEISWCSGPRAPTGFYVDERIGLTVTPGCAWNDKAGSRWRVGMIEAPSAATDWGKTP